MKIQLKYIYLLAFITVAYILLPVMNADYLYTIQDNNVFISGHTFMMDTVQHEGGWDCWVARYLTQFFYHPWLGSTILILFWVAIYWTAIGMFGIKERWSFLALVIPAILLYQLLDYGYWIYYAKAPGLPFRPTFLVLFCLLFTWGIMYPTRNLNISWRTKGGIAVCLLGIIIYVSNILWPSSPWHYNFNFHHSIRTTLTDKNFKHELKMYRALDEFRFEDVLAEMPKNGEEPPTNLMVLYKNIALMHTGQMDKLFETNSCGIKPDTGDSPKIHISQLGAPLIFYMFGQTNFAYRRAMENSVQYSLSFRNLKMMTKCAIFNHEFDVAKKYITILKASTFHREWALEHEAWMENSTAYLQSADYQTLAPLLFDEANTLDNDQGMCEKYIMEHFTDLMKVSTPLVEDVELCMSLLSKDSYAFCVHFYYYAQRNPDIEIPLLYQEGAILLGTAKDSPLSMNGYKFNPLVADKYNRFVRDYNLLLQQGLDEAAMGKRLKGQYGTTYWWYYYFYNKNFY